VTRQRVAAALVLVFLAGCQRAVKPGDPLRGLSRAERERFAGGKVTFDSVFTPQTGLGPLFNSTACGECHEAPVAGGNGDEVEVHAAAFKGGFCDPLIGEGGPVVQQNATPALKQALGIDKEPVPPSATATAARTSPAVFGRGLLDAVPDAAIIANREVPRDKWKEFYLKSIADLKPGLTEMIVHLGHDDSELQAVMVDHEGYGSAWRQKDYDGVNSPEFKKALQDKHVIVVTWKELGKLLPAH
jgi:hypothetical protein